MIVVVVVIGVLISCAVALYFVVNDMIHNWEEEDDERPFE